MKNKTYLTTYVVTLIVGIVLLVLNNRSELFSGIAVVVGILFLAVGILSIIQSIYLAKQARQTGSGGSVGLLVASIASVILGLLMIVDPNLFVNLLVYAIAAMLILCGGIQLYNFIPGMRAVGMPWWLLVTPALSVVAGIVIICLGAEKVNNFLALVTGIVLIVYSINGFIGYFKKGSASKTTIINEDIVNVK